MPCDWLTRCGETPKSPYPQEVTKLPSLSKTMIG